MHPYDIKAEWDGEAAVRVASSDDMPGLATGADTFEELFEKLKVVPRRLIADNYTPRIKARGKMITKSGKARSPSGAPWRTTSSSRATGQTGRQSGRGCPKPSDCGSLGST